MKKVLSAIIGLLVVGGALSGCTNKGSKEGAKANSEAQRVVQEGFVGLQKAQPIPVFKWSALRQALIDAETIQAKGVATTTAFYLEGIGLVGWCPSKGLPVPSTYQLSPGQQYIDLSGDGDTTRFPVDQGEPTGVYTGDSTGTYVICLDDNGAEFLQYWEGPVSAVSGVRSLPVDIRIIIEGDSSFDFGEGR